MTSPEPNLQITLDQIHPVDTSWMERACARQLNLTKPPGSLGRLEEVANRLAAIQQTLSPVIHRPTIIVFAADHGVCEEGVNPYPQAVTAQMAANFARGGAAINALTRAVGAELLVVDAGIAHEIPETRGLIRRPIAAGTRNFCAGPAMSPAETTSAIALGIEMAEQAHAAGSTLLGIGEMGIGNSTAAAAVAAALTGLQAAAVTGPGTGADAECLARKRSAVERALALHAESLSQPLDILASVGGLEIGAMCGVCLGGAAHRQAVLVDGFIATAAAALAVRLNPTVRDYLFAAHRSTEPGHTPLLAIIGHKPLLDLNMRLGEGTGAALAVPILRAAVEAFTGMATFDSAGVSQSEGARD